MANSHCWRASRSLKHLPHLPNVLSRQKNKENYFYIARSIAGHCGESCTNFAECTHQLGECTLVSKVSCATVANRIQMFVNILANLANTKYIIFAFPCCFESALDIFSNL